MQALQLVEWQHDPELRDVAEPDPGPGEVVVRIGGAGVCHSDLHLLYEFSPGSDAVPTAVHARPRERRLGPRPRRRGHRPRGRRARRRLRGVGLRTLHPLPPGHGELLRQRGDRRRVGRARSRRWDGLVPPRTGGPPRRAARRPRPGRRRPADRRRLDPVPRHPPLAARSWCPDRQRSPSASAASATWACSCWRR